MYKTILAVFLPLTAVAQNLVPNYSFENLSNCPDNYGKIQYAAPWGDARRVPGTGTTDLFAGCEGAFLGGTEQAKHGNNYAGIFCFNHNIDPYELTMRSYLQVRLLEKLKPNTTYHVSFYVSLSEQTDRNTPIADIGAYLSQVPPTQETYIERHTVDGETWQNNASNIEKIPQVRNDSTRFLDNSQGWMKIQGQYHASGNEEYVTIGCFGNYDIPFVDPDPDKDYNLSYYYVDLVTVFECGDLVDLPNDTTLCVGEVLTLDAFLDESVYRWQNGSTNATFDVTEAGWYRVDVGYGACEDADSIYVSFRNTAPISLGPDQTFCEGSVVTLAAEGASAPYRWSDESTKSTLQTSEPGLYVLHAMSDGCMQTDSIMLEEEPLIDIHFNDTSFCNNSHYDFVANAPGRSVLWSNGSTEPSIRISESDTYSVQVRGNACHQTFTANIGVFDCVNAEDIPNVITPNGDGANELFVVNGIDKDTWLLEIHNRYGKTVYRERGYRNSWAGSALPTGIYYYSLLNENSRQELKGYIHILR